MRIFNLIGEGFHALRSLITTKESAMTDTSMINSTAQTGDAALPQFAVPDSNVPTNPQLQRLSSPSTVAPATSEETPGETHVAPDATAQHTPAQPVSNTDAEAQPAVQATEQQPATDTQSETPISVADAAAGQTSAQASNEGVQQPAAAADSGSDAPAVSDAQPAAAADSGSDAPAASGAQPAAAADSGSDAPAVSDAQPAVAAGSGSGAPAASSAQPSAAETEQSDFSAGVKDFSAAFDFVQQGIEHLGTAARNELFALARKYL